MFTVSMLTVAIASASFGAVPAGICPVDAQTNLISYQAVVKADGISGNELYSRAKYWIATNYRSAKTVIDLDDKEAGRIVAKGIFNIPWGVFDVGTLHIRHKLVVEVKDGKYRYLLTELVQVTEEPGNKGFPLEAYIDHHLPGGQKSWERIHKECNGAVESLAKAMGAPVADASW